MSKSLTNLTISAALRTGCSVPAFAQITKTTSIKG